MNFKSVTACAIVAVIALAAIYSARSRKPVRSSPPAATSALRATNETPEMAAGASNVPASPIMAAAGAAEVPKGILDQLAELGGDSVERQAALDKIAAEVPSDELERTLDQLWERQSEPGAKKLARMLLLRWAHEMPGFAAGWLTQKGEGEFQSEAALGVASVWAGKNVSGAADWVRQWPEDRREKGILAVAYEAASAAPKEALALAAEMPPGGEREELIRNAASNWAAREPDTALAWVAQIEASPLRDDVIAGVSLAMSEKDPAAAAELAIETLPPGKKQNNAVIGIVQRWAQQEPARAAAWVGAFPDGPLRQVAAENLVNIWAERSAAEAGEWINSLPPGEARDSAVAAYSGKVAADSPEEASIWVETIDDLARREQEMRTLAERWLLVDAPAARKWIDEAPLPPDVKSRLLSPPEKPPANTPPAAE